MFQGNDLRGYPSLSFFNSFIHIRGVNIEEKKLRSLFSVNKKKHAKNKLFPYYSFFSSLKKRRKKTRKYPCIYMVNNNRFFFFFLFVVCSKHSGITLNNFYLKNKKWEQWPTDQPTISVDLPKTKRKKKLGL